MRSCCVSTFFSFKRRTFSSSPTTDNAGYCGSLLPSAYAGTFFQMCPNVSLSSSQMQTSAARVLHFLKLLFEALAGPTFTCKIQKQPTTERVQKHRMNCRRRVEGRCANPPWLHANDTNLLPHSLYPARIFTIFCGAIIPSYPMDMTSLFNNERLPLRNKPSVALWLLSAGDVMRQTAQMPQMPHMRLRLPVPKSILSTTKCACCLRVTFALTAA